MYYLFSRLLCSPLALLSSCLDLALLPRAATRWVQLNFWLFQRPVWFVWNFGISGHPEIFWFVTYESKYLNLNRHLQVRKRSKGDLGSKREDRLSDPFELVQNNSLDRFSYLLRLSNFPRDMRKFLQKCQKIAGCWERAVYVRNLRSSRHLAHPLRNGMV